MNVAINVTVNGAVVRGTVNTTSNGAPEEPWYLYKQARMDVSEARERAFAMTISLSMAALFMALLTATVLGFPTYLLRLSHGNLWPIIVATLGIVLLASLVVSILASDIRPQIKVMQSATIYDSAREKLAAQSRARHPWSNAIALVSVLLGKF